MKRNQNFYYSYLICNVKHLHVPIIFQYAKYLQIFLCMKNQIYSFLQHNSCVSYKFENKLLSDIEIVCTYIFLYIFNTFIK